MKPRAKKLESINVKFGTKLEFDRLLMELMAAWGRKPSQDEVTMEVLRVYRESKANSSANSPTIKSTDSPLTSGENTDYNCATPQEIELQHALSRIMRSGNQRVIASVVNLLAASEEFAQLGVALGRTDAEPSPAESRVEGDPELPEKLGGNVQIIGGRAAGIRGKGARGQH